MKYRTKPCEIEAIQWNGRNLEEIKEFAAIAICGGKDGEIDGLFPPCGVCRQVMREFCEDDFEIYLLKSDGIETYTLEQLLPVSFRPENLQE